MAQKLLVEAKIDTLRTVRLPSMIIRLVFFVYLMLSGQIAFSAETILESSVSTSTLQIGNAANSETGTGISLGLSAQTGLPNKFILLGEYSLTNATVNGEPLRSMEARGGFGYSFQDNLSVWTGAGSSTAAFALYKSHSIEGYKYDLADDQIDLGFTSKFSLAPQIYSDFTIFGSLNDPDETYQGSASIGYQMNFGTIKLIVSGSRSVVQSIDTAETRIGLSFSTNY